MIIYYGEKKLPFSVSISTWTVLWHSVFPVSGSHRGLETVNILQIRCFPVLFICFSALVQKEAWKMSSFVLLVFHFLCLIMLNLLYSPKKKANGGNVFSTLISQRASKRKWPVLVIKIPLMKQRWLLVEKKWLKQILENKQKEGWKKGVLVNR